MGRNRQWKRTHRQPVTNQLISNNAAANGNSTTMSAYKEPTYTAKADVYSFGITCYEILTGNSPFDDLPRLGITDRVMAGVRPELPANLDTELAELIRMCWDQKAEKRPTFEEVCTWVQALMMPTFEFQPEIVPPGKKKNKRKKGRK
jgi:serine/threonine protein kinase